MCLAVPGELLSVVGDDPLTRAGRVRFGEVVRQVNLALLPEAGVGDYILVHVGIAIARIDAAEAERIWVHLRELGELEPPPPS